MTDDDARLDPPDEPDTEEPTEVVVDDGDNKDIDPEDALK